jgi:DNA-binding phage protein
MKKPRSIHKKIARTAEENARIKAIREKFARWHPGPDELAATGEYDGPIPLGEVIELQALLADLRRAREAAKLTLAEVAERTGMNRTAVSRLENGRQANPTFFTLVRYARAVGRKLVLDIEEVKNS